VDPDFDSLPPPVNFYQSNPDQKTSDVSKPGHTASSADIQYLDDKPKSEDKKCWDRNNSDEKKQENQGQNSCPRVQDQISSKHPGNSAACPDHRDARGGMENNMRKTCSHSRKEIEKDKSQRPEIVFDVISEYPEIEHVEKKMKKTAMDKHGSQES
jgi:hypothetical protein